MKVDILFFADRTDLDERREVLSNVHTVAVIIDFAVFAGRSLDAHTPRQQAHVGLKLFLRYIIPNVEHFSIEMPRGKLEHSQTTEMHDRQGEPLPTFINMNDDMQDIEDMPLDSGHDWKAWDWLLKALDPVKTTLTSLSLPRIWYSSTGIHGQINAESIGLHKSRDAVSAASCARVESEQH